MIKVQPSSIFDIGSNIPTLSNLPRDTRPAVAEVLAGWIGVPVEALLETESTGSD